MGAGKFPTKHCNSPTLRHGCTNILLQSKQ